jgi:hypothetical protein
MATKSNNGSRSDRHRPGYIQPKRQRKHVIAVYFTDAEFEAFSTRVQKDGITKERAGKTALLNYAKRGLTNG